MNPLVLIGLEQEREMMLRNNIQMILLIMIGVRATTDRQLFRGDGTFYGEGGHGAEGACMLPRGFNGVATTVAINSEQWENAGACGKCVLIEPSQDGLGMTPIKESIKATIDNVCPECHHGDLDLGMSGDGRWKIQWSFVSC